LVNGALELVEAVIGAHDVLSLSHKIYFPLLKNTLNRPMFRLKLVKMIYLRYASSHHAYRQTSLHLN
jgi:hypothetical protein